MRGSTRRLFRLLGAVGVLGMVAVPANSPAEGVTAGTGMGSSLQMSVAAAGRGSIIVGGLMSIYLQGGFEGDYDVSGTGCWPEDLVGELPRPFLVREPSWRETPARDTRASTHR